MRTVFLFGLKGVGKSYFGKRLAESLKVGFIDTDEQIQKRYAQSGKGDSTCREIALQIGEAGFRKLENEVILSLQPTQALVIALGGGTLLNPHNLFHVQTLGELCYLKTDPVTLKERLLKGKLPSFFDPQDIDGSFERMLSERLPIYEAIVAHPIDLRGKSEQQVLRELMAIAND